MKVLIRNHVYNSEDEPIIVLLEPYDIDNISKMPEECNIYADYPEDMDDKKIDDMMLEFGKGQIFG